MNALYSGCIADPWLEVADQLKIKHNINPVYWVGWNNEKDIIENFFKDCIFLEFHSAWRGVFPDLDDKSFSAKLDGEILIKYSYEEGIAMKMMDRQDPSGNNFSFNERQQFFRHLLRSWLYIIENYEIELVISPSIPHRVFDYTLYVATLIKKIKFISFKMTVWPGYLLPLSKIDKIPIFSKTDTQINTLVTNYFEKTKGDYNIAEPYYMKAQKESQSNILVKTFFSFFKKGVFIKKSIRIFNNSHSYWKKKGKEIEDNKIYNFQRFFILEKGKVFKRKLKKIYDSNCTLPNYSEKYIFVALHYQPEETSCPSGHIYVDQSLMVETLLKYTPNDVKLYIKEHSSQFHPLMEGETGRYLGYYSQLLKHERVKLISTKINSFELIDNSIAIATLTGTVGLEALIRQKPVLVFGTAWYEHLSGIFRIRTMKDLEVAIDKIESGIVAPETTKEELNGILNNSIKAYHYGDYKEVSGVSKKESILNLVKCINSLT
jgi:hypothetical protein